MDLKYRGGMSKKMFTHSLSHIYETPMMGYSYKQNRKVNPCVFSFISWASNKKKKENKNKKGNRSREDLADRERGDEVGREWRASRHGWLYFQAGWLRKARLRISQLRPERDFKITYVLDLEGQKYDDTYRESKWHKDFGASRLHNLCCKN